MFQNKNLSVIGSNLLFKGMDESVIKQVFNSKNFLALKEGALIFQAGDESNHIYLILQGEVKVKYSGVKGSGASFRRGVNEFFGEQEVLEKTSRISSAVADTDCIFYLLDKDELSLLIKQNNKILNNLDFTPAREPEINADIETNDEPETEKLFIPGNDVINQEMNTTSPDKEKIIEEDLTDFPYEIKSSEELIDLNNENYLSYSGDENEDLNFDNNGFKPEEKHFGDNNADEIIADHLQNEELNDTLPDLQNENPFNIPPEEEHFGDNNADEIIADHPQNEELNDTLPDLQNENPFNIPANNETGLVPAIDDFERIPEEPQKFNFTSSDAFPSSNDAYKNNQPETETLTLIEIASGFINNNILYPLNEIKKYSELLSKSSSLSDASEVNELIKEYTDLVRSIIDSSLSLVSQNKNLNLKKQGVKKVFTRIFNLLSDYVESRNARLFQNIETDALAEVDELKLHNVFLQLAKNACDSMPEGGNIFVTVTESESKVKIEFVDEGIGIPSSLTFEVFEPMVSHGKKDGAGLGLSIAKKIIMDHKGDISVYSELGEGTKIFITIPVVE